MALQIFPSTSSVVGGGNALPITKGLASSHTADLSTLTVTAGYKTALVEDNSGNKHLGITTGAALPTLKTSNNNTYLEFQANEGLSSLSGISIPQDFTILLVVNLTASSGQTQIVWNESDRKLSIQLLTSAGGGISVRFGTGASNVWTKDSTILRGGEVSNILIQKASYTATVFVNGVSQGSQRVVSAAASQWVSSATASSQFGTNYFSANRMIGANNSGMIPGNNQGNSRDSWSPANADHGKVHTLNLTYTNAVRIEAIEVLENQQAGNISKLEAQPVGETAYTVLYEKNGSTETGGVMSGVVQNKVSNTRIQLTKPTKFLSSKIRISIGGSGTTNVQVDSVKLQGLGGADSAKLVLGFDGSTANTAVFDFYALHIYRRILSVEERHKVLFHAKHTYDSSGAAGNFDHSSFALKSDLKTKVLNIENSYVQKQNHDNSTYIIQVSTGKRNSTGSWANRTSLAYT